MSLPVGLTSEQAKRRLQESGPNLLVRQSRMKRFLELREIFLDPMGLMLLGLAGLYFGIGNPSDGVVLLLAFLPISAVNIILQLKSRNALRSLGKVLKKTAKVYRDRTLIEIDCEHIVPGDVIAFEEGQALPADGLVVESQDLTVNESALTGESVPVDKSNQTMFYAGTTIQQGRGLGLVQHTGNQTRFGKISSLLEQTKDTHSPLQLKVNHLIKKVIVLAIILTCMLFAIEYSRTYQLAESLIIALTFGMAAVPEEFPLVFTLYLSLGAWRLSKHGILVKSLPSVETLGSVTVICTDKTGTLTEGVFQVESIVPIDPNTSESELWISALMACEETIVDAMEAAISKAGSAYSGELTDWRLKWDYPFDRNGKHMSHVWEHRHTHQHILVMKGAVEGVLEHCDLDSSARKILDSKVSALAGDGKRILGLACRTGETSGDRVKDEKNLRFLGLIVFSDPVRSSAREAVIACQKAGIVIKMLTGDHPLTAHAVAEQTGMTHDHSYLYTGSELTQMSLAERTTAFHEGAIFSRVLPAQKHEILQTLQASGAVVAMTGDGINDAPALKLADIGISMGASATEVARASAKMILLKNDFRGILEAVLEGRRIFENLKRSFSYLISFHIPLILLALIPPLFGKGNLLLPIHIVLLELVIHPVSAFSFENLPTDSMRQNPKELLTRSQTLWAALSGILLSAIALLCYFLSSPDFYPHYARTLAFMVVLSGNIAFVWVESWPCLTKKLWITTGLLLAMMLGLLFIPYLNHRLHLIPLSLQDMTLVTAAGLLASMPNLVRKLRIDKRNL